jgi:hypothetical protein
MTQLKAVSPELVAFDALGKEAIGSEALVFPILELMHAIEARPEVERNLLAVGHEALVDKTYFATPGLRLGDRELSGIAFGINSVPQITPFAFFQDGNSMGLRGFVSTLTHGAEEAGLKMVAAQLILKLGRALD